MLGDADLTVQLTQADSDRLLAMGDDGDAAFDDLVDRLDAAGADRILLDAGQVADFAEAGFSFDAGTDVVVLPGGFSYGDYLRCGAIAARAPIMDAVRAHAARGGYVLAVCNGFQIACEAGLLPGVLMRNAGLKFVCRMQHLQVGRVDVENLLDEIFASFCIGK